MSEKQKAAREKIALAEANVRAIIELRQRAEQAEADLNRAKAVVECWQRQPKYYDDCDAGQNDPHYAWYAEMERLVGSFYASLKMQTE